MGDKNISGELKRRLTLPLLILYGLGVTIGAGIYVLVGVTAAEAGLYAPISFLLAAIVVSFTGFSYCELSTRFPLSAGEANYVEAGFGSKNLSLFIGLLVAASGVISSAAVSLGAAGYIGNFIALPQNVIVAALVLLVGTISIWGILESVGIAALFTLVEVAGLGLVIYFGLSDNPAVLTRLPEIIPPLEAGAWLGIVSATLLAFFAFIGFEDMANVAEEVRNPSRTMPRGIIATLVTCSLECTHS